MSNVSHDCLFMSPGGLPHLWDAVQCQAASCWYHLRASYVTFGMKVPAFLKSFLACSSKFKKLKVVCHAPSEKQARNYPPTVTRKEQDVRSKASLTEVCDRGKPWMDDGRHEHHCRCLFSTCFQSACFGCCNTYRHDTVVCTVKLL